MDLQKFNTLQKIQMTEKNDQCVITTTTYAE